MDACDTTQYTELTIEFHCTFRHKEGAFSEANAVSFSLGRNLYEMTIPQFGVALGLYSSEEVATEEFVNGLRVVFNYNRPKSLGPTELGEFWGSISTQSFAHTNLISSVRDPIYRYILKMLATTVVARKSGENKANWLDIFALMCMVEKRNWNLASFFAWSFNRPRRGGKRAALDMGPYITRLARNIRALTKYKLTEMNVGMPTVRWGVLDLQLAGILTQSDPPEWNHEVGAPPQRQPVPRERRAVPPPRPVRPPRPNPFTPEAAFDYTQERLDQMDSRMRVDQQWVMQSHHRQDDMLRYMMSGMALNAPVPQPFAGLLPPPVYGGDQQAPYVYGQYPGYDQWGGQSGYAYSGQFGWQQAGGSGSQQMEEDSGDDEE